jgi:hypothetical protein
MGDDIGFVGKTLLDGRARRPRLWLCIIVSSAMVSCDVVNSRHSSMLWLLRYQRNPSEFFLPLITR